MKQIGAPEELVKEAESKLVYSDEESLIEEPPKYFEVLDEELRVGHGTAKLLRPMRLKSPDDPTPGAVMQFRAVVTTVGKDRDGDKLEPEGARVDMKGPLLWNHNSDEPIGKMVKILKQNTKQLLMEFAIINNELGRNIADLIEFGALQRMSHGFIPEKFEEMKTKEGDFVGWHVQEYEMVEVSVVSVASNPGAVIGAFSQGKITHPLVKNWASKFHDERPVVVRGADLPDGPGHVPVSAVEYRREILGIRDKAVIPYAAYPPADKGMAWDADAATKRMNKWAGGPDKEDVEWAKFAKGFAVLDGDADNVTSYKLPHHDVVGGDLVTVFKGLSAAVGALNGARAEMDVTDAERKGAYSHLVKHYKQFDTEPPALQEREAEKEEESMKMSTIDVKLNGEDLDRLEGIAKRLEAATEKLDGLSRKAEQQALKKTVENAVSGAIRRVVSG